jgi:DNA primase
MDNALKTVSDGRQLKFMFLPDGEDPDSIVRKEGKEGFRERLKNSMSVADYLFSQLSDGLDLSSLDARARLAELALPKIGLITRVVLHRLMLNRLSAITQLPVSQLDPSLGVAPARRPRSSTREGTNPDRSLARQLLKMLLWMPELAQVLAEDQVAALMAEETGRFVGVLSYLRANPDAETDQILGRWSGEAEHAALLKLAALPNILQPEDLKQDFCHGIKRFQEEAHKRARLGVMERLREDGSTHALQEYWKMKKEPDQKNSLE